MVALPPDAALTDAGTADAALDRTFAALAHPVRRAILGRLARGDSASVSELAEPFDVSLMAISKHVAVMEEAGLLAKQKDGRIQRCTLQPESLHRAAGWIEAHRRYWEAQLDALSHFLADPASTPPPEDSR